LTDHDRMRAAARECAMRERRRQGLAPVIEDASVAERVRGLLAHGG
jgi:hypothetical protein